MFGALSLHLLLLLLPATCRSALISQWPECLSLQKGKTAEMHCYQNDTSYIYMYWYRQLSEAALQLVATSVGTSEPTFEDDFKARFKGTRRMTKSCSLKILKLEAADTAVYFCAANDNEAYFGTGTKVVVMEHPVRVPNVMILKPSPAELRERRKATVVCLVTDFYPDNIQIHWYVDGEKQPENDPKIQSDPESIIQEDSKSYSVSSRIRFKEKQWVKLKKVECRVNHYTNGSESTLYASELHVNAEICSMSKEAKARSMTTARMTYLMVLCKSILYALFVSMIVWKSKISHSKRFD
ncbi:immunoglobulin lambda-1 light chain-like [Rhincodon typus]|uniref:immunoglobulin lambda-1 light chain-like n=1 Tax=Rhincodon typus TaxID=259920 RepID=UPI00202ECA2B|nr:immunoglobulin lambda-1 light chain-like [Rhincodon typus]